MKFVKNSAKRIKWRGSSPTTRTQTTYLQSSPTWSM